MKKLYKFLLNKLYKGLLFDFYLKSQSENLFPKFDNFFSHISETVLENKLFRSILSHAIDTRFHKVNFDYSEHEEFNPDGYYNKRNVHMIFEFKNSMLTSSITNLNNFEKVFQEIQKKFATKKTSKNRRNKGIYQLLENAKFLLQKFEHNSSKNIQYFYPVLIVNDELMSVPGVRYFLNEKLKEEYGNISNRSKIILKELVVIKLSTLFNLTISKTPYDFKGLLDEYLKKVKDRVKNVNKSSDFDKSFTFTDDFENVVNFERISLVINESKFESLIGHLEVRNYLKNR